MTQLHPCMLLFPFPEIWKWDVGLLSPWNPHTHKKWFYVAALMYSICTDLYLCQAISCTFQCIMQHGTLVMTLFVFKIALVWHFKKGLKIMYLEDGYPLEGNSTEVFILHVVWSRVTAFLIIKKNAIFIRTVQLVTMKSLIEAFLFYIYYFCSYRVICGPMWWAFGFLIIIIWKLSKLNNYLWKPCKLNNYLWKPCKLNNYTVLRAFYT